MAVLDHFRHMSITEATHRGVSGLVTDAAITDILLERHGEPVAAVIGMDVINTIEEARADLRDLALVLARAATDTGERTSLDAVIDAFGLTREGLAAMSDED